VKEEVVVETEKLIRWEPLESNPFERFYNVMDLRKLQWNGNFELSFLDHQKNKIYHFTYKQDEANFYAIRHFRMLEEFCNTNIEMLIDKFREERVAAGLPKLTYNPTFYKIQNSSFLTWYRRIDPTLPLPENCRIEHHLYICANYFIDVLTEQQPIITDSAYDPGNE